MPFPLAQYYANAASIYKFWVDNGFTQAQAAGLLAQADAESSCNPQTNAGDAAGAFGLFQWHTSRAKAIMAGCGVDVLVKPLPSLLNQLKGALWELRGPEHAALSHILAAKTAYDAGHDACRYWERPLSTLEYIKRGDRAEFWLVYYSKNPVN